MPDEAYEPDELAIPTAGIGYAGKLARRASPLEMLKRRKFETEKSLENINKAIEALEANPQITNILELLSKVGI